MPIGLSLLIGGCGGKSQKPPKDTVCKIGVARLKKQLGPEFGRIEQKMPIYRPKRAVHACALVYRRLAEENPEELPPDEVIDFQMDHRLALVTVSRRTPRFRRVRPSPHAPSSVRIKLRAMDMNGDGIKDFVVEELAPGKGAAMGYKGLRIFDGAPGRGEEILSLPLRIKTVEGLELIPNWRAYATAKGSFIELSGAGQKILHRYDPARKRFIDVTPKTKVQTAPASKAASAGSKPAPKATSPTPKEAAPKKPKIFVPLP